MIALMKDRKNLLILAAVVVVVLLGVLVFLMMGDNRTGEDSQEGPPGREEGTDRLGPYSDAPRPWVDEEELDHFRDLWPDAFDQQPIDKEAVKREWADFAERYPDNVYVPSLFKPEMTLEEKEASRKLLDQITSIESKIASARARSRKSNLEPPHEEADPGQGDITPEEQKLYFVEKLKELNSRKQLIEYVMQQGELDADQITIAREDLAKIESEIKNITEIMLQLPG